MYSYICFVYMSPLTQPAMQCLLKILCALIQVKTNHNKRQFKLLKMLHIQERVADRLRFKCLKMGP